MTSSALQTGSLVFSTGFKESAERTSHHSLRSERHQNERPASETQLFPTLLSVSLLYPDTAPRSAWRPQVHAWMRRHNPAELKRIVSKAGHRKPYTRPPSSLTPPRAERSDSKNTGGPNAVPDMLEVPQPIAKPPSRIPPMVTPLVAQDAVIGRKAPVEPTKDAYQIPDSLPSPPKSPNYDMAAKTCISCGCSQSPCWRPAWSPSAGQLCNSCGLRYKKTGTHCLSPSCSKVPSKSEWAAMARVARQGPDGELWYACLDCNGPVDIRN